MAAEVKRIFVPFGELKPDGRLFNNDGMIDVRNVVPLAGNYSAAQYWFPRLAAPFASAPLGFHVHPTAGNSWRGYAGLAGSLLEINPTLGVYTSTNKTRTVGGAYGAGGAGGEYGWQGASFGDAVVMTDYVDDLQLLTSPAAANFVKMAQSGGANPGMDPKAKFAWAQRSNFFLANLNLSAPFDGLAAGANPTVVAWSASDNLRQYGSYNATPQLTGTGYQPLAYDMGYITGGIPATGSDGSEYSLISMQQGWVRCEGPPYNFRVVSRGSGCQYPNSIVRLGTDVYFWGSTGPMRFTDGLGPPVSIGNGKVARTLTNNAAGFSAGVPIVPNLDRKFCCGSVDSLNRLIFWAFTSVSALQEPPNYFPDGNLLVVYSVDDDRFSFIDPAKQGTDVAIINVGLQFLAEAPDRLDTWQVGRDVVGVLTYNDGTGNNAYTVATPIVGGIPVTARFQRAFQQVDPDATSRFRRIRPVIAPGVGGDLSISVTVLSKNSPLETAVTFGPYTGADSVGWITMPNTKFADFHCVLITVTGSASDLDEVEGYEGEYELGGSYAK